MTGPFHFVTVEHADRSAVVDAMQVMKSAFDPVFGEAWNAAQLSSLLTMPGSWLTLIYAGNAVVGFALMRAILDEAELLLIAVQPQWRGRSAGSQLLEHALERARGRGVRSVHLEVRRGNAAANKIGRAHV